MAVAVVLVLTATMKQSRRMQVLHAPRKSKPPAGSLLYHHHSHHTQAAEVAVPAVVPAEAEKEALQGVVHLQQPAAPANKAVVAVDLPAAPG